MFINLVRWWLAGILFLLPFQRKIAKSVALWSNELSAFISYLDEITIFIFLPLAIREFYKNRENPDRLYLILLFPVLFLSMSGFISGMVNGNSLLVTTLGTIDYIKNFLVIFIFAAFFREFSEIKKIFRLLLLLAVFLGVIAFIQEIWAMVSRYILEKDFAEMGGYLLGRNRVTENSWRFGIYRTPSLMHNSNLFGLYMLLILTIYLFSVKKVNFAVLGFLFAGIFLSISRIVYLGFIFMIGVYTLRNRKWLIGIILIPVIVLSFFLSTLPDFDILGLSASDTAKLGLAEEEDAVSECEPALVGIPYRVYAREKAMEVWKDHIVFGVGPGMFGGVVSVIFESPVYEEYDFIAIGLLSRYRSLDQFWPQVLAELGIIGTLSFAGLLISLLITFLILRHRATSDEMKGLSTGLATFIIVMFIYFIGNGLNITPILFTYSAFVGMGLGFSRKQVSG